MLARLDPMIGSLLPHSASLPSYRQKLNRHQKEIFDLHYYWRKMMNPKKKPPRFQKQKKNQKQQPPKKPHS